MRARLLLAGIVFTAFTLSAQQQRGSAPGRATTGSARLRQAHTRSASNSGKRDIAAASASGARTLERLRLSVLLGVFDDEAGVPEDVSLLAGRISPYPMPRGIAHPVYAEPGETGYPAARTIEKPDVPRAGPTVRSRTGCWWQWVFTGVPFCA